ncbi:MAG TPA: hypothetical protein VFJ43_11290 [Bacteroidia bacterium]|nr:hypothetical protein [Bacteroidia bacterium]
MKKLLFLILLVSLSGIYVQAQTSQPMDTVYLMSGKTVTGVVKDSSDEKLKILILRKGNFKADFIDLDLVYSVKYSTGTESVFYKQDTLFGNYYSAQEVKFFLQGERDARKFYRCPIWTGGAFVAGFLGGYTKNFFLTFLPPFVYAGSTTFFRIKIRPGTVSNPDYLKYDTYLLGYEKQARQHRIFKSLIFGGIGMVSGFITSSAIQDYRSSHP